MASLRTSAAPPTLEILLPHLFASGLAHLVVNSFLRQRLAMPLPGSIDWSTATARGRRGCPFRRRIPYGAFAIQVGQQVGGAIPNATDLRGQHRAVEPALGSGLDSSDQHAELLRKRDELVRDEIARRLLLLCGFVHCQARIYFTTATWSWDVCICTGADMFAPMRPRPIIPTCILISFPARQDCRTKGVGCERPARGTA